MDEDKSVLEVTLSEDRRVLDVKLPIWFLLLIGVLLNMVWR